MHYTSFLIFPDFVPYIMKYDVLDPSTSEDIIFYREIEEHLQVRRGCEKSILQQFTNIIQIVKNWFFNSLYLAQWIEYYINKYLCYYLSMIQPNGLQTCQTCLGHVYGITKPQGHDPSLFPVASIIGIKSSSTIVTDIQMLLS